VDRPEQVAPGTLERALAEGAFVNGTRAGSRRATTPSRTSRGPCSSRSGSLRAYVVSVKGLGAGREEAMLRMRERFFRSRFLLKILVQKMEE
jgi:hypothetical protein